MNDYYGSDPVCIVLGLSTVKYFVMLMSLVDCIACKSSKKEIVFQPCSSSRKERIVSIDTKGWITWCGP